MLWSFEKSQKLFKKITYKGLIGWSRWKQESQRSFFVFLLRAQDRESIKFFIKIYENLILNNFIL